MFSDSLGIKSIMYNLDHRLVTYTDGSVSYQKFSAIGGWYHVKWVGGPKFDESKLSS